MVFAKISQREAKRQKTLADIWLERQSKGKNTMDNQKTEDVARLLPWVVRLG